LDSSAEKRVRELVQLLRDEVHARLCRGGHPGSQAAPISSLSLRRQHEILQQTTATGGEIQPGAPRCPQIPNEWLHAPVPRLKYSGPNDAGQEGARLVARSSPGVTYASGLSPTERFRLGLLLSAVAARYRYCRGSTPASCKGVSVPRACGYGGVMSEMPAERLWRPVGLAELRLIEQAGCRAFPPRLPQQPIFYPVLNFEYAEQIARDWNSQDDRHDFVGYVTEFDVQAKLIAGYEPHQVGGHRHRELWVPAAELTTFNDAIVGEIRVVAEYHHGERIR
jgi:hypothetical protein